MAEFIQNGKAYQLRVRDLPSIMSFAGKFEWLVEGLIPSGNLIMLSGESGSGKSTVALILADAVSRGVPFLELKTTKTPVLIADRENSVTTYQERFERFHLDENPDLLFWGRWTGFEPGDPDCEVIKEFVREEHPLIIFDSYIAFNEGDEQDATATREYTELYRKLVDLGATVIVIHHTGKADSTKEYRGSSDIKASLDIGLVLTAPKPNLKHLKLRPFKVREGDIQELNMTYEDGQLLLVDNAFISEDSEEWKQVHDVIAKFPGLNQSQIIEKTGNLSMGKVRKVLSVGVGTGAFLLEKGERNASFYFVNGKREKRAVREAKLK